MKHWLLVFVLALPAFAAKEKVKDDQMIRDVHSTFWEAWNHHDGKQMAAMYADDGTLINPAGRVAIGREAIEKLFTEEHSTLLKDSVAKSSGIEIRFISRNIALVDEDLELSGCKGPDGKATEEPMKSHVFNVLTKKAGKWWASATRPYSFMPAPGGEIAHKN